MSVVRCLLPCYGTAVIYISTGYATSNEYTGGTRVSRPRYEYGIGIVMLQIAHQRDLPIFMFEK